MTNKNKIVDGLLVLEYQSGNTKALQLLVKRWHKTFCNKAFWLIKDRDTAKDIAQESWKTILKKLHALNNPNAFGSWSLQIVYNKSLNYLKSKKKEQNEYKTYSNNINVNVENTNDDILKRKLLKAIKTLPERQQVVLNLFYVQDYALSEIAEILNISAGTVKSRLYYAREQLKSQLKT